MIVRGAAASKPRKAFYTRSISDPGLIPLLIASGVTFGAIQVSLSAMVCPQAQKGWPGEPLGAGGGKGGVCGLCLIPVVVVCDAAVI